MLKLRLPRTRKRRIILGLVFLFFVWILGVFPPPLWYRWSDPMSTAFMEMRDDQQPEKRDKRQYIPVPLTAMSRNLRTAVMIGEDNRFYEHGGLDMVQIRIAMGYPRETFAWGNSRDRGDLWKAMSTIWKRRTAVRGASTISQQLAKNLYLSPSRNPLRKLKELVTTWRLEFWLPKDRILELYLNSAEMGEGIWGVEAASRAYFGKSARNLSDYEAATLAGLLPFPRSSNPKYRPGRMAWRRDYILRRMHGEKVEIPRVPLADPDSGKGPPDSLKGPPDTIKAPPDTGSTK